MGLTWVLTECRRGGDYPGGGICPDTPGSAEKERLDNLSLNNKQPNTISLNLKAIRFCNCEKRKLTKIITIKNYWGSWSGIGWKIILARLIILPLAS